MPNAAPQANIWLFHIVFHALFVTTIVTKIKPKNAYLRDFNNLCGFGGEEGIRTLDAGLPHTPLAGERLRPLGHLSGDGDNVTLRSNQGLFALLQPVDDFLRSLGVGAGDVAGVCGLAGQACPPAFC